MTNSHQVPSTELITPLNQLKQVEQFNNSYTAIMSNGLPLALAIISQMIVITINFSCVSSDAAKAGLGLTGVFLHSFGGSLLFGYNYGFATFASRAFGAKNITKFRLFFIQGFFNFAILIFALILLSTFSQEISVSIGQEKQVSYYTELFLVRNLPGYISFYTSHFIKCMLQAQDIIRPIIIVDGGSIIFHIIITSIAGNFLSQQNLVVFCTNCTLIVGLIGTLIVERKTGIWKLTLDNFKIENPFEHYKEFLRECSYIALPVGLDMFIFEFMAIFVGYFQNNPQTAAHVIILNVFVIMASIYIGFSSFMGTRIGNLIGENKPQQIKIIVKKVIKLCLVFVYLLYFILFVFQDQIINFYSKDPEVEYYIKPVIKFYSIMMFVDTIQFVASVYFKSLGYGQWVIKIFSFCFYVVGLAVMLLLAFVLELKIMCAWIGNFSGLVIASIFYYKKFHEIDLQSVVVMLHQKVKHHPIDTEMLQFSEADI